MRRSNAARFDVYVRTPANGGSDTLGNGTPRAPFATPARALQVLEGKGIVHMGSGVYPRALLADIPGPLVFYGDGGGDPNDTALQVVVAPQAAAGGTGAGVIIGTGLGAAQIGDSIEWLDGVAIGERRTIVAIEGGNNLIPARNQDPAPAPGDSFRIVRSAVTWDSFQPDEIFMQHCGSRCTYVDPLSTQTDIPARDGALAAIYFVNVQWDAVNAFQRIRLVDSMMVAYGLELTNHTLTMIVHSSVQMGQDTNGLASNLAALLGQSSNKLFAGYTISFRNVTVPRLDGGTLVGYWQQGAGGISGSDAPNFIFIMGGQGTSLDVGGKNILRIFDAPRLKCESLGTSGVVVFDDNTSGAIDAGVEVVATAGDGVVVSEGGHAQINSQAKITATQTAVNASQGGAVYTNGNPNGNWSGSVADTRVSATETQPAAFYAALDSTLVAACGNGSLISRVDP